MKQDRTKCIWIACIGAAALCITATAAYADGNNLGHGYISNVSGVNGECAVNTTDGGTHKWDVQASGTYDVTISGIDDACSQGQLDPIQVIVHNSTGGNIVASAVQLEPGVYKFRVTLTGVCLTMPIEYCTAGGQPATGLFAQGYDGIGADGHMGHLRTATFGDNCAVTGEDTTCQGQATPTPTPCGGASITACKYYDFNANGIKDASEQGLINWPFCLTSITNSSFAPTTQAAGAGGCTTFSNLPLGTYVVTEGSASSTSYSGFFASTYSQQFTIDHCGQTVTLSFGNYCTVNSGGLTMGFWSNKNGNKLMTGNANGTGTVILGPVVNLLNACQLRNADGSLHTFTSSYSAFRNWLLSATATNMAYMLSAQLAALELNVQFGKVDGNAFDLCADSTVSYLIASACDQLHDNQSTLSGNAARADQEHLKNCIDALNNNGQVVPVTPCDYSGASVSCGQ